MSRQCGHSDCDRPHLARGFCNTHYRQAIYQGRIKTGTHRPAYAPDATCEAEGCDARPRAQGLCASHYRRQRGYKSRGSRPVDNALKSLRRGRMLMPQQSSPYRALARTCDDCGDILTTPDHLIRKDAGALPGCPACALRRVSQNIMRRNNKSRDSATNHGKEWTGPELEVASRTDLTTPQVARMLGRTIYAVRYKRRSMDVDPRAERLAGVTDVAGRAATEKVRDSIAIGRGRRQPSSPPCA